MKVFLSIMILVVLGMSLIIYKLSPPPVPPVFGPQRMNYSPLIVELVSQFAQKQNLIISGHGGKFTGGIKTISSSFISLEGKQMDILEARHVIIELVNDMVEAINADSDLRPFLVISPFTPKQIDLSLFNHNKNNGWVYEPAIGTISFFEGTILYSVNSKTGEYVGETIRRETYTEAVEILKKEKANEN